MTRERHPSFREHDTTLSLGVEDPKDARVIEIRNSWVRNLRARGFRVRTDAHTAKHYPILKKYNHQGNNGHLQFKMRLYGRHLELMFFQDLVRENSNGGQYDFDKRLKMPYLIGKQYEAERRSLVELMGRLGYAFSPDIRRRGMDFIDHARAELSDFQGSDFYTRKWNSYNTKSGAGREMADGDLLYFRDYDGRAQRGIGYRNINNMWWILLPCGTVRNVAASELWHRDDLPGELRGRFINPTAAEKKLRAHLARTVKAEEFERAAIIRDALRARYPAQKAA